MTWINSNHTNGLKISFYDPANLWAHWQDDTAICLNKLNLIEKTLGFPKNIWGLQLLSALTSRNVAMWFNSKDPLKQIELTDQLPCPW